MRVTDTSSALPVGNIYNGITPGINQPSIENQRADFYSADSPLPNYTGSPLRDFYNNLVTPNNDLTTPSNPRNVNNNFSLLNNLLRNYSYDEWRDFDYLSENYPRYRDKIQEMRNKGIPDRIIERVFVEQVEPRLNFVARRDQVNNFLGRTPESMQRVADYENARRFDAYRQAFPDKSDDEIFTAIGISQWSGVAASTLLSHPELFKKLTEGQKVRESFMESVYRGGYNHYIQSQIGDIGLQYLRGVISKDEAYQREKELSSQYIPEPLVQSNTNKFGAGGSQILTQGYMTLGEGALTGLATGTILAVAGYPLGASGQGFQTGYKLGNLYASARRLFSLQAGADMLEFSKMVDENGQPINENAARAAACITGAITVATELYTLPGIAKLIPGGDKLMQLAGFNRQTITTLLTTNPTFRSALSNMVIDTAKGVGWGTINNIVETLGQIGGSELAKTFSGQPFPQTNVDILERVKDATISSVRDFTAAAVPNLILGLAQINRTVTNQRQAYENYRAAIKELSETSGVSEAEIERQFTAAVNTAEKPPAESPAAQPQTETAPAPVETVQPPEIITQPPEAEAVTPEPVTEPTLESPVAVEPVNVETETPPEVMPESPVTPEAIAPETIAEPQIKPFEVKSNKNTYSVKPAENGELEVSRVLTLQNGQKQEVGEKFYYYNGILYSRDSSGILHEANGAIKKNIETAITSYLSQNNIQTPEAVPESPAVIPNTETTAPQTEKPDFVFIPREQLETFKAEHPEFTDIEGLDVGKETGLTREQFDRLRTDAPEFTASIAADTREGADGKTLNEEAARIETTDQTKAAIFHSQETQQLIAETTQDYINAGETQEEAETLANVRAVINTVMLAREGVPLMPIKIKDAADTQTEQDLSRISPEYNINNPETWPDQERAQRFMELTNWRNLSDSERNIKELLDILRNAKPDKADNLSEKSKEVIKGLKSEQPDNVRSEYNALLRAEYEEGKRTYQESAQDVKDSLSARTDLDPTRYENNSEFPAGKKRNPDMSYSFEELGVKTKIDIATDTTDLKVRIKNAGDKNPLIFSIKNYRAANLSQVLKDILSGTTLKDIQISETPLAQYIQHALHSAWERLGLDMTETETTTPANNNEPQSGYFYTDPFGQHVSAVTFKYGKAIVELLRTQSNSKNFAAHVHDIGHVTFKVMENLANSGSIQMQEDLQTILKHANVTLEDFNADRENKRGGAREKAHEYFANAFMVYLFEGKAPTKKLDGVFERVKRFLLEVYDDITHQLNIEIDDEVREVFDRLLTLPGDESTSIADYALEDIQISHQIEKYQKIQRQAELDYAQQMADIQDLQENPENWEPPAEAIEDVQQFEYEVDYIDLLNDELKEQQEYIKSIVQVIKENGGLRAADIINGLGKELANGKVYAKWRNIWNGVKSGKGLEIDKLAKVLESSGFPQFTDTNTLLNWLLDTDNSVLKENPQTVSPRIAINGDTARAFIAVNGAEATIKYMKDRLKFINDKIKDSSTSEAEREALQAEVSEIQEWIKKIDPALDEEIAPVKKPPRIPRSQMREAVMTGYKLGESKERALQKMNLEIYKSSWQERAQARFEQQLQQAREKDKKNYRTRLERQRDMLNESKNAAIAREQARRKSEINKYRERIKNIEAARRAKSDKNKISRMIRSVVKISKSPSILYDRLVEIKDFLKGYNFDKSKAGRDRRDIIRNFLNNEGEQYTSDILDEAAITPEEIQEFTDKIHLEDMTINDVKNLYNTVKNIYDMGRREFAIWKAQRDERRAGYASRLGNDITSQTKEPASKTITNKGDIAKQFTLGMIGELGVHYWNAVQTPGRFLAGLGENFRQLFEDRFTELRSKAVNFITERETNILTALKQLGLSVQDFFRDAIDVDGQTYTWNEALAIYAGMKNEKSRKAIIWGNFVVNMIDGGKRKIYNTYEEGLAAINKILDFVNNNSNYKAAADLILNDLDTNFDRINRARIEAFNKGMEKEENYTPIFRLRHQSNAGLIDTDTEQIAQSGNAQALMQKLEDGFTVSRENISEMQQQPINLNLFANWIRAIHDQEYLAALGGYASDLASAILSKPKHSDSVQELIKSRLGVPHWNTLRAIFNDSINDSVILETNAVDKIASYLVKGRSFAYVAFSPMTMLTQTASYFTALPYTNRGHLFRSLADFLTLGAQGRGREFLERVYQKSPELRITGGDPLDRSISENLQNRGRLGQVASWGYVGVQTLDNWTKCIVFDAVYQSRLADGYSEQDAIRLANRAVHDTQPASTNREQARITRVNGVAKLFFTQFMNALVPIFNMAVVDVARNIAHPSWNKVKATAWSMLAVGLTIGWAGLVKDKFSGKLPTYKELDDGSVDDWPKWWTETEIDNLINTVPVFNSLLTLAVRKFSGRKSYRQANRLLEPAESLIRAWDYLDPKYEGEKNDKALEEFLRGMGLIGVPIPFSGIRQLMRFFGFGDNDNE